MNSKKTPHQKSLLLILLVASLILGSVPMNRLVQLSIVAASPEEKIYVDPPSIIDPSLTPGSSFTVNLNVQEVVDLYAWQVYMTWDPSILDVTTITFGDFLAGQPEGTLPRQKINQTVGFCIIGETTRGKYDGVDGDGWLASVEFLVIATGETVLDISGGALNLTYYTQSTDPGTAIYILTENGYFSNLVVVHDVAVTDVVASPSGVAPGDLVYVDVDLENQGTESETFDVTVKYDSAVIATHSVTLASGASTTESFTWDTTGVADGTYTISAEAEVVSGETDTADNTFIDGTVTISVAPPTLVLIDPLTAMANPGESFTVNINVSDVEDLHSWSAKIRWKLGLLTVTNAVEGPFLKPGGDTLFTFKAYSGYVDLSCVLLGVVPGVSGSGTLANVTFQVIDTGNCTLNLYDVTLLDKNLQPIEGWSKKDSPDDSYFYTTYPVAKPVSDPPYNNFFYTPNPVQTGHPIVGEELTFNASACYDPDQTYKGQTGTGIVSYQWDFGDGTVVTEDDPITTHTYATYGSYTMKLTITDDDGETDWETQAVEIRLHDIAVINVTVTPSEVKVGEIVYINVTVLNKGSVAEYLNVTVYYDGNPIRTKLFQYIWFDQWGNPSIRTALPSGENYTMTWGTTTVFQSLVWDTTGMTPGTYTISAYAFLVDQGDIRKTLPGIELDLTDNTFTNGEVTISSIPEAPNASFIYEPAEPLVDETVTFDASASTPNGGTIVSYEWDFGDGTTGTGMIVTHTYTTADTYTVTLNVTDSEGFWDTETQSIAVSKLTSTITLSASPTTITIGESTTLSGAISPIRVGVDVTIHYRVSGDETWSVLTTVLTDGTGQYSYVWAPLETGTYELKASWEGDEKTLSDESSLITVEVLPFAIHDIAVRKVIAFPVILLPSGIVSIEVIVENQGTEPETFNLTVYYDNTAIETTLVLLDAGSIKTLAFSWNTTGVPEGSYTIRAEATVVPGETDTADNIYIDGDVTITLTRIYVDPPISMETLDSSFTVDIKVADVVNLYAWQVNMTFDPTVLECVNATEGDFLKTQPETVFFIKIDNTRGFVLIGCTTKGKYLGVNGSGTLTTVEFHVLATGESVLNIDHPRTMLLEVLVPPVPPGEEPIKEIPCVKENGYVTVAQKTEHPIEVGGVTFNVITVSNSSVSDFAFNQVLKQISFKVTGLEGTVGFCSISIPKGLLGGAFTVLINDISIPYELTENETHYFLYFTYTHSTHTIRIVGTTVATPPIASFTYSPSEPVVGETVTFDASGSYDPDGTIASYSWDFGDGTTTTETDSTATHTYTMAGIYTVILTVTDNDGLSDTITYDVTVTTVPELTATVNIDPDTLNLKSKGRWITCYITLPKGYSVSDIDVSTIMLDDIISAEWGKTQGDVLMIKFRRDDVIQYIKEALRITNGEVTFKITGKLTQGVSFKGEDTIRVISKGADTSTASQSTSIAATNQTKP